MCKGCGASDFAVFNTHKKCNYCGRKDTVEPEPTIQIGLIKIKGIGSVSVGGDFVGGNKTVVGDSHSGDKVLDRKTKRKKYVTYDEDGNMNVTYLD